MPPPGSEPGSPASQAGTLSKELSRQLDLYTTSICNLWKYRFTLSLYLQFRGGGGGGFCRNTIRLQHGEYRTVLSIYSAPINSAGIFKHSVGLSYRPARLHRLAELIPWNRFLGSLKFKNSGSDSPFPPTNSPSPPYKVLQLIIHSPFSMILGAFRGEQESHFGLYLPLWPK